MAVTLSQANYNLIVQAADRYVKGNAPENQIHDTEASQLAKVAASIGFVPREQRSASVGAFLEAIKLRPLTTLMDLAAFIGKP